VSEGCGRIELWKLEPVCSAVKIGRMKDGSAPGTDWTGTLRRIRRELTYLTRPKYLKRQWALRVTKPRFGIETVRDFVTDMRYGGWCGGTYKGQWDHLGYNSTSSTHYYYLSKLFNDRNARIGPHDVLVDVGCGKGRVINFWLSQGLRNRIVGIEIDERWADFARKRLSKYHNVEVICGDAFKVTPADGTVFFIFNPFTRETTLRFKEHLAGLRGASTPITLVYYNCHFADIFESDPAWEVTPVHEDTFHPSIIARLNSMTGINPGDEPTQS
jgi:SAM-dependent methyltransferase